MRRIHFATSVAPHFVETCRRGLPAAATRIAVALSLITTTSAMAQHDPSGSSYPWRADSTTSSSQIAVGAGQIQTTTPPIVQSRSILGEPETILVSSQTQTPVDAPIVEAPVSPAPESVVAGQDATNQQAPSNRDGEIGNAPPLEQPYAYQPALSVQDQGDPEDLDYCGRNCRRGCNLGCERKLFGRNCNGLELGGWSSIGYHNRDTIMTNNRKAEANVHQVWFYADQAVTQNRRFGYHVDLLYGIDGQDLQAFGNAPTGAPVDWDNSWDYGSYGWAMPQAYLQTNFRCWDIKIGKFFSPFGYEVIAAPENFFYSHSYTMFHTEPFTMTGAIGERQIDSTTSRILGITLGWDTGFDRNSGGFNLVTGTRKQLNEFVNVALTSSIGDTGYRDSGVLSSAVAQVKLTENLDTVLQVDTLNLDDNQEFGVVHYLFREISPCLKLGTRLEWWKSDQLFNNTKSTYEFTMGANWRPNANITLRPEIRFDWGAAAIDPGSPIFGFDAVVTF